MTATPTTGPGAPGPSSTRATTTAPAETAGASSAGPLPPLPVAPRPPGLRRRRRRGLLGLGVALVVLGVLGAVWLAAGAGDTVSVLAVARPVALGEVITDADLTVARVVADPALNPVPAARRDQVVGRRAATALLPGSLLTGGQVTDASPPAAGFALVGVAVRAAQMPDEPLRPGDRLLVVSTPPVDGEVTTDPPATVAVTVVGVGARDDTGLRVVDVTVPAAEAAELAARAATGRVALVLQPRGPVPGAGS